jgi:hypothetical protein
MLSLTACPDEVLMEILELSRPYAFESLVLTCTRLHAAATPLLRHHNALRQKYRSFSFTDSYYSNPIDMEATETIPELLLDIANDPIIARYIIHADLGKRVCTQRLRDGISTDSRGVLQKLDSIRGKEKLMSLFLESEYLKSIHLDPAKWFELVLEDKEVYDTQVDYPTAFLFTLLPNIASLTLSKEWGRKSVEPGLEPGVPRLMELLVARANDDHLKDQPLQKLRVLHSTADVDRQAGTELVTIAPFLALNSLRKASHSAGVLIEESSCWSSYGPIGKHLEILHLDDCVVNGERSALLFKDMSSLRVLTFEYNMKDEIGYEWNINRFVENVMTVLGGQLESLSLTASNLSDDAVLLEEDVDFHEFEVLQHLELDTKLFIVSSAITNNLGGESNPTCKEDMEIPALVEMLPESLCTFVLHMHATKEDCACIEVLFQEFDDSRAEQLPLLEKVTVIVDKMDIWGSLLDDYLHFIELATSFCAEASDIIEFKTKE